MRSSFRVALLGLLAATLAAGCIYPRRSTSLSPVSQARQQGSIGAPADLWHMTIVEAHVAPRKAGDLPWDDGDGLPDVFVRFMRDGVVLFETPTIDDTLHPEWNADLPRNVRLGHSARIRIEVWDNDTVGSDPIGIYEQRGLPDSAVEGADARIMLERGSWLTVRRTTPRAHRGLGIDQYELQPGQLTVNSVLPYSPAGRAGIEPGDAIIGIGEQEISALNDGQAASALSMSATRHESLRIRAPNGDERTVELDRGYVWLTM